MAIDESEQQAIDAVQAEKAELGIVDAPVEAETEEKKLEEESPAPEVKEEEKKPEEQVPAKALTPEEGKELKQYKAELREQLQKDFDEKFEKLKAEMVNAKPEEKKEVEDEIKALAEELKFDPEKTRKLIEVARKGIETLTPEDKAALEEYKASKEQREKDAAERAAREEAEEFNTEWATVLPEFKKQFPNASEEQIAAAKQKMDELAHTEKYAETDLDYVMFKERETFGKILFSPKQKTFESPRVAPSEDDSAEFPTFRPDMTPAEFEAFEKRRAQYDDHQEPLTIRTRDERGRVVERKE